MGAECRERGFLTQAIKPNENFLNSSNFESLYKNLPDWLSLYVLIRINFTFHQQPKKTHTHTHRIIEAIEPISSPNHVAIKQLVSVTSNPEQYLRPTFVSAPKSRKIMSAAPRAAASGQVCDVTDLMLNQMELQKVKRGCVNWRAKSN